MFNMKHIFVLFFIFTISIHANEKVVLELKWLHQFQFAGYYAAKEKGFYKEVGLDVEIKQRDISKNNVQQIIDGKVDYGISDSSLFKDNENKKSIKIIAPIFQHSADVIFTLKSSGIDSPYKLENKNIVFDAEDTGVFEIHSLIENSKVTPNLIKVEYAQYGDTYKSLIDHSIDAYSGYSTIETFYFKKNGIDINTINPANYGFDLYGDILFTSTKEAKEHPKRVEKFKQATIKGWYYALEHKDEIIRLIKEKYPTPNSVEHLKYEADALDEIIDYKRVPIGTFDKGRVQYIRNLYKKYEHIKNSKKSKNYLYKPNQNSILLTKEEIEWIKNNPTIKFAEPTQLKPFFFLNNEKKAQGILVDYLEILSQRIGIKIGINLSKTLENSGHNSAGHKNAKLNNNYGNSALLNNPTNQKEYLVTKPYIDINFAIFSRIKKQNNYKSISDLKGKKVAILKDHRAMKTYFSKIPDIKLIYANNVLEQINMIQYGEVDAIVGYSSYHDIIDQHLTPKVYNYFTNTEKLHISIGVNKEHSILLGLLNKAITSLSSEDKNEISSQWIKSNNIHNRKLLSPKELKYLKNKKTIKMCIDPNWMPYAKNENGKHIGLSSEYTKILEKKIGIPIKMISTESWNESLAFIKKGKCDILSLAMSNKQRRRYLDFTQPFLSLPLVIVTSTNELFIDDISTLKNKKIGITKGYFYTDKAENKYKNITFVEVQNLEEGLRKVVNKELYAYIDTLASAGYYIQNHHIGELKIAGQLNKTWELGIASRSDEPMLSDILNKAINQITPKKRKKIFNRWVSVKYEKNINYTPLVLWGIGLSSVFLLVFFIVLYLNERQKLEIKKRKEVENKLHTLSITDGLTTLYNRRHFNEVFTKLINSATRDNTTICFAIMDIDFFKQYNDTYGHDAGDKALQAVSSCLKNALTRADDYCFRLGGEEFGLLFKGLSYEEASQLVQKIRKTIEKLEIEHKENSVSEFLTASFGLIIEDARLVKNKSTLYKDADTLLYEAKNSGRNRVVCKLIDK